MHVDYWPIYTTNIFISEKQLDIYYYYSWIGYKLKLWYIFINTSLCFKPVRGWSRCVGHHCVNECAVDSTAQTPWATGPTSCATVPYVCAACSHHFACRTHYRSGTGAIKKTGGRRANCKFHVMLADDATCHMSYLRVWTYGKPLQNFMDLDIESKD